MQRYYNEPQNFMHLSGIVTLLLSNIVLFFTLGFFYIKLAFKIYRCGKETVANVGRTDGQQGSVGLILGKQLRFELPDHEYIQRLARGKNLFETGQVAKLVVLGGITGNNKISEAQAGKRYLVKLGVPSNAIIAEDKSRYTIENLQHARKMLGGGTEQMSEKDAERLVVLITNRYHLNRSSILALGIGLKHKLCAAEKDWQLKFDTLWRLLIEAYYLHWYFVGKYWSRLTNNKAWLKRIS